MRTSKFFRFTIAGDELDVSKLKEIVNLPADIYYKDTQIKKIVGKNEICIPQKTNRWVYSNETIDSSKPETFLTNNLKTLKKYLPILKTYIQSYKCRLDLILYCGDKTDIRLQSKQMKMLSDFGVNLHISFC